MNRLYKGLSGGIKSRYGRLLCLLMPLAILFFIAETSFAQGQSLRRSNSASPKSTFDDLTRPSTSKTSAQEALHKIPWNVLGAAERKKLESILTERSIYRRLPMAGGYCNPELFDLALCNPEIVVAFWDILGYPGMTLQRTGPWSWHFEEKAGTVGDMEALYHDNELVLLWARGRYKGPGVATEIVGDILLILQVRYTEDKAGEPLAICRMDSFVRVYNVGYEMMSRMFAPLLGRVADANFTQTVAFVGAVSKAAEENPAGLMGTIGRITTLTPDVKRMLEETSVRVEWQMDQRAQGQDVVYTLMPKKNQQQPELARILSRDSSLDGSHDRSAIATKASATASVSAASVSTSPVSGGTSGASVPGASVPGTSVASSSAGSDISTLRIIKPGSAATTVKVQPMVSRAGHEGQEWQRVRESPKFSRQADSLEVTPSFEVTPEPATVPLETVALPEEITKAGVPDEVQKAAENNGSLPVLVLPMELEETAVLNEGVLKEGVLDDAMLEDWSAASFSQSGSAEPTIEPTLEPTLIESEEDITTAARDLLFSKAMKALEEEETSVE